MHDLLAVMRVFQIIIGIMLIITISRIPAGIILFLCFMLIEASLTLIKIKLVRKETFSFKKIIKQLFSV
jgi:hypothetical protein